MKEFIEKLIGRLEEIYDRNDKAKKEAYKEQEWERFDFFTHRNEGIYIAMAIINKLAEEYNNDVCEWERYEEKRIFFKHCTYRNEDIDEFSISKFKFCPYCGKKIKVVK